MHYKHFFRKIFGQVDYIEDEGSTIGAETFQTPTQRDETKIDGAIGNSTIIHAKTLEELAGNSELIEQQDLEKYKQLLGRYKDNDLPDAVTELVRHDDEQEIKVYGLDHSIQSETLEKLEDELATDPADVYFVELFPSLLPKVYECVDANTAFQTFGESGYIAWLAHQKGKDVRSWDNELTERLEDGYKKLGDEGVEPMFGSFIGSGMIHVISQENGQQSNRAERFMDAMQQAGIAEETFGFFEKHGQPVNPDTIKSVVERYADKDIDTLTKDEISRMFEPYGDGPINNANRAYNEPRDDIAMQRFYQAKTEGAKKVTVLTGKDHTRLWQKSLGAMYPQAA